MLIVEYKAVACGADGDPVPHPAWPGARRETVKPSLKQARAWAHRALLDTQVASVVIRETALPALGEEWVDGPAIEVVDHSPAPVWTWMPPHWDKPHRCPDCHRVAERAWTGRGYGPRTRFRCLYGCRVQWRVGSRAVRLSREWRR